jgi:hypothetical protein
MAFPIIGGILGVGGVLSSIFGHRKAKQQAKRDAQNPPVMNVPTMTPGQISFINEMGKYGLQGAQDQYPRLMGDLYQGFQPVDALARMNYMQQQAPGIAEQFTGMGMGAQRSSAFPQYLSESARQLESGLAQQRQAFGMNQLGAQQNFMSLLAGQGLQKQFEPIVAQKAPSPWPGLLGSAMSTLPYFLPNQFGPQQGGSRWF